MVRRSVPASSRWTANAWRSECGETALARRARRAAIWHARWTAARVIGVSGTLAGKEPVAGPVDFPPGAQDRQQLRREHHVAVLLPLALRDAQHHAFAVDGGHGEVNGLGDAQTGGVARGQDGVMLRGFHPVEKLNHFFRAEHDR